MSKLRLLMVGVLAVFAFAAVASAAQAAKYLVEGAEVTKTTPLKGVTETGTTNLLKGTPFGVTTEINCTKRVISGASIGSAGAGAAEINFSTCTVVKPANCTVAEPIKINVTTSLLEPSAGVFETEFTSTTTNFTEILMEGASCSLKGNKFPVAGKQVCALPGAGTEAFSHELECKVSGSKLTAGGKTATFESNAAHLELEENTKKWSAHS